MHSESMILLGPRKPKYGEYNYQIVGLFEHQLRVLRKAFGMNTSKSVTNHFGSKISHNECGR
jgi:hypothetical protein